MIVDMNKSEAVSRALLAAKMGKTEGTSDGRGRTVGQLRILENMLCEASCTYQTDRETDDVLILSLLATATGGSDASQPGTHPETPGGGDDPELPGSGDTPGDDDPELPGGGDTPGGDDPEFPGGGSDVCTRATGSVKVPDSNHTLSNMSLTPDSGTAFSQEPNRVTFRYSSGSVPSGYRIYAVTLERSGSSWTVSYIRVGNNSDLYRTGGSANVSWGIGWTTLTVSGIKAVLKSNNTESNIWFAGNNVVYSIVAEVV